MTTQPKTSRVPAPIYAAAGAGDLALQQLRKIPALVSEIGSRVASDLGDLGGKAVVTGVELRQKATDTLRIANLAASSLREKAVPTDVELVRLRETASHNAAAVRTGAQAAQARALAVYGELVARGERVVGAGVVEAAKTSPAATTAERTELTANPADLDEAVESKPAPAKRPRATRPTATSAKPVAKRTRQAAG